MKIKTPFLAALAAAVVGMAAQAASAAVITQWTFETSVPAGTGTSVGPFAAEVGSGGASAVHATSSTISSPAGNGSAHSLSSNTWAVGDYYQFTVNSPTTGLYLTFDQTSSNTGPGSFQIQTSLNSDGTGFTALGSNYTVLANATPNPVWTTTTAQPAFTFYNIALPDNIQAIRLVDMSATSANGGTVASAGTDRVDNVTISDAPVPVPEPASMVVLALGGTVLLARRRR